MISISSADLKFYLESTYNYQIIGLVDLDQIKGQPRNTLYKLFKQWYNPVFAPNDRIVLYSKNNISKDLLVHIQKCCALIDISNFFILICEPTPNKKIFEQVTKEYSHEDGVFSSLAVNFIDQQELTEINTTFDLPESFCFNPWAHLEISSQGQFKPCCVYKESIKDSNNIPYNINQHTIQEVYNSEYLKKLRQQFLLGERPQGCSSCWFKEQHHGESNRIWFTDHLGINAHLLNIEQESMTNLISLDIKLGNLCNFKCRICNAESSSKFAEEQVKYFQSSVDLKKINSQGRWTENEKIWKMFESLGDQLVNLDFYGGEPFLIRQQEVFLDYLIKNNFAHKIRLHYNSNGSVYPTNLFKKWKHFREVDIAFSIDNIESRFELERGGNWPEVENNLDQFLEHKLPNMILSIYATINVQNVYYLDQLIDWVELKKFNALIFSLLESPSFLSITHMSKELTEKVIKKLNQIDPGLMKKYKVTPIIDLVKQNKFLSNQLDDLSEYMLKLDNIRNQSFSKTHSEIASIIYKGN